MIKQLMRRTWQLPEGVPSGQRRFLQEREYFRWKWIFKFLKRRVFVFLLVKQCGLTREIENISDNEQRILWINWAAPSLGDSLMDLSARVLLKGKHVTLLTHPKNAPLYMWDPIFKAVFSDPFELKKNIQDDNFDLVICDSFSPRVLVKKLIVAPLTPFVGLYGFINGFEVHRTLFAFERMKQLLGISGQISIPVRPLIGCASGASKKEFDVCIAVGGEWLFRTYRHWSAVVERLLDQDYSVLLVGSHNGSDVADSICSRFPGVASSVGKIGLSAIATEIARARVFVGSDGGLWHIACALPVPTVVLFADCQIFDERGVRVTRETSDMVCETLYDNVEVSQIKPETVVAALECLTRRVDKIDQNVSQVK